MKNDKSGCVASCYASDTSRYGNNSLKSCVDECAQVDYIDNSN